MDIQQDQHHQITILAPQGRLDSFTTSDLEQHLIRLLDQGTTCLLVDFVHLDYISSAGLRVLLMVAKRIKAMNGTLALCTMRGNIREVFEMSGFDRIFTIYVSREEALASM